jgi:Transposase
LWGAGLARYLAARGVQVVEVNRPNRQNRRRRGKSDTVDAEAAARTVLAGEATVIPKAGTGPVEALRQLRVARAGAMKARTAAANPLHSLVDTAPERVRAQLRDLTFKKKITVAARWRSTITATPDGASQSPTMGAPESMPRSSLWRGWIRGFGYGVAAVCAPLPSSSGWEFSAPASATEPLTPGAAWRAPLGDA